MKHLIINIHGFLSSFQSEKVLAFKDSINALSGEVEFLHPKLPNNPEQLVMHVESIIDKKLGLYESVGLIGHSLGGYYATHIASKYDLRVCLVNPVVRGYEIMCEFYGNCYNPHTNENFEISERDIEFLVRINKDQIERRERFLVLQQLGDEIVDPKEVLAFYQGCQTIVEEGGCHDFTGFAHHTKRVTEFLLDK